MTAKRPNKQPMLPFTQNAEGEARRDCGQGAEAEITPSDRESPAAPAVTMMGEICSGRNLAEAMRLVIANKGAAGVDGVTVRDLPDHWRRHGPGIVDRLLNGTYKPSPVKRVKIPKPDGGVRNLGIPTVTDRVVQQAILQVLQPQWDPTFSDTSYGFRPGRSAHQAINRAKAFVADGHDWVVDIDIEKFFDRVNHDRLMRRLHERTPDQRVTKVIRAFLNAGIMEDGLVSYPEEGTPQGGPLSPLLSNIVLDELDKELERRGHAFVRYADDCNIYVRSRTAGERVMKSVSDFISGKLKLKVSQTKSAVDQPGKRKFLGFTIGGKTAKAYVSAKALERFKDRIRELTRRGIPALKLIGSLNRYLRGWVGYFGHAEDHWTMRDMDSWIRRRLRSLSWRSWRTPRQRFRQLHRRGVDRWTAARTVRTKKAPWAASNTPAMRQALPVSLWHDRLHLLSLLRSWHAMRAQPR